MKPNKRQEAIIAKSNGLAKLTKDQIQYAADKHTELFAVNWKRHHNCLTCGHKWQQDKVAKPSCPKCKVTGKYLNSKDYRQGGFDGYGYTERHDMAVIDFIEGYQVVRFFRSEMWYRKGKKRDHTIYESMRHYVNEKGIESMTLKSGMMYYDGWIGRDLEFRVKSNRYDNQQNMHPSIIYPKMRILPEIKRNGFKKGFHGMNPHKLFAALLTDNKVETMFKMNQHKLADHIMRNDTWYNQYLIALRHGYEIKDVSLYDDYLGMLVWFKRDLRNPKYLCPADLKKEHDRLLKKQKDIMRKKRLAEMKAEMDQSNIAYQERIKPFANIEIKSGDITIRPIPSVQAMYEEGDVLDHCVFSSAYYDRENSLILSARMNGIPLETIELDLTSMKIEQARGFKNKKSKQHKAIVRLLKQNIHLIAQAV